ncbi:MFS transporter [Hwanghaeella sp.]|uniref:MFS transporter n=1 Tax=Hwanghaeella sp. TaxID=2605943 RepID=UPI003CCC1DF3
MFEAIKSAWALFLGLAFIMLGNGLQGSLVAVRAQFEVFNTSTIGVVMAGYFVGFFLGSVLVPRLVARVGHVRVFGALASLASFGVLVYPIFVDPITWFLIRVLTGICYAGLYIICESWLNDRATNETRGQLLSIYMIISLLGMAGGQYLLNLYSPADFQLFTIVSVLISLSVVPVLVSAARVPEFEAPETMGPIRLYKASPLGVVSMMLVGMGAGVIMGMGPSYAYQQGLTVAEVSIFMSAIFIGGFLFTWPIGKLSDLMDRRTVIVITAGAAVAIGGVGATFGSENKVLVFIIVGITGGVTFPIYSLAIAHTNDFLSTKQMVAASSALVMTNGLGAMLGPNIGAGAMEAFGPEGFYIAIAGIHIAMAGFALWRMTRRSAPPTEEQSAFVAVPRTTPVAAAMSPEYEHPEDEMEPEDQDLEVSDDLPETHDETASAEDTKGHADGKP